MEIKKTQVHIELIAKFYAKVCGDICDRDYLPGKIFPLLRTVNF
jgi:hypothetical protein